MSPRLFGLTLFAATAFAANDASARSSTFEVVNQTGYTLTAIYAGPSSQEEWGENILDHRAASGSSVEITINHEGQCEFDLRYDFSDADTYEEYAIDVCSIDGESYVIK